MERTEIYGWICGGVSIGLMHFICANGSNDKFNQTLEFLLIIATGVLLDRHKGRCLQICIHDTKLSFH